MALETDFVALDDIIRSSSQNTRLAADDIQLLRTRQFMIAANVGSVLALLSRVHWMRERALADDYAKSVWGTFTGLDIELFHVYLRSTMDYVSDILVVLAAKPGQVGVKKGWSSYEKLAKWLDENQGNRSRLGNELADLVASSKAWFSAMKSARDEIVHRGALTLVFGGPQDGVLFQVHRPGFQAIIAGNEFLAFKEDILHFDRYAVLYLAHLMVFLDDLARIVHRQLTGSVGPRGDTYLASDGLQVVAEWIDALLDVLGPSDKEDAAPPTEA